MATTSHQPPFHPPHAPGGAMVNLEQYSEGALRIALDRIHRARQMTPDMKKQRSLLLQLLQARKSRNSPRGL